MIAGAAAKAALRAAGRKVLVTEDDTDWTAADLDHAIDARARQLSDAARPGGTVGLWAWNSTALLCAHLAAERAGLTRIAIDPEAPPAEAEAVISAAGMSVLLTDADHTAPAGIPVIPLGDEPGSGPGALPEREVAADDIAVRISRGFAGGDGELLTIPLSFANWEAHMDLAAALFADGTYGPRPGEPRYLTVQQLQYGTGLVGSFPFLRAALPQVILRRFDASAVAEAVQRHRLTSTFMVPGMVTRLARVYESEHRPETTLRILYGGAPFAAAELDFALKVFGPRLIQLYGRFEGGWPITVLGEQDHQRIAAGDRARAASCGRPVTGVDVALEPVPGGTGTQLRVRSECVSPAFRGPDGWCDLGDLARQDADCYVYLDGRIDGMINTGSFHVYPAEVEAAIAAEFPGALTVTVTGKPDPKWGQTVAAEITWPAEVTPPSVAELRQRMASRLAKYKIPTRVEHNLGWKA